MIETDEDVRIDASPEEAFDFIADPHNHPKFTPSLMDISNVGDNDVGKEGEYTFKMVGTSTEGRFFDVEFDRPTRRTYELEGDIDGSVTWTIEDADGGVRVRYQSTVELPGPDLLDTITERIGRRYVQSETESTLENLKVLIEEGDAGT